MRLQDLNPDVILLVCMNLDIESLYAFGVSHVALQRVAASVAQMRQLGAEWQTIAWDVRRMQIVMRAMRATMSEGAAFRYAMRLRKRREHCHDDFFSKRTAYCCAKCARALKRVAECEYCRSQRTVKPTICGAVAACLRARSASVRPTSNSVHRG